MTAVTGHPPSIRPADVRRLIGQLAPVAAAEGSAKVLSPFTSGLVAEIDHCGAEDVAKAVATARDAQLDWAEWPIDERAAIVLGMHDLLLDRQEEILDLLQWETGKARVHAFMEIAGLAAMLRHYARRGAHYLDDHAVRGAMPGVTRTKVGYRPKGVVGVIAPWNYPIFLGAGDTVPALLSGNAVVGKADEQAPLSLLWIREAAVTAGLPADVWQLVYGPGAQIGPALIDHVDYISFTGSTKTGRQVAERAASRLIGCSLELGGKNPMIVCTDADVPKAAANAIQGCFSNTGQMCIHIERIYVHEKVYDKFAGEFVKRCGELRLGASYGYDADMGSLTLPGQLETVTRHVEDARSKGASVLTGGRPRPDLGPLFYEPTVLTGVTLQMEVYAEETFGPVVSLYPVASEAEAVQLANEGQYGLNASVWTKDAARGRRLAATIKAGQVNVNDTITAAVGSAEAPMGGFRDSGLGRRHGAEGIRRFTEPQAVAVQWPPLTIPSSGPYGLIAKVATAGLKAQRRLRLR